jgi:hypothetical protein
MKIFRFKDFQIQAMVESAGNQNPTEPIPKFKNKEEVASLFRKLTGDYINTAKARMAGFALRQLQREHGNLGGAESEPYNDYQKKLIDVYDSFAKKSPYLFHVTPKKNLPSIIKSGLLINQPPRFKDVSQKGKIYLAANEEMAKYYGSGDDVILRVRKNYVFDDLVIDPLGGGEGTYTTGKSIPPDALEVKIGRKYVPLEKVGNI